MLLAVIVSFGIVFGIACIWHVGYNKGIQETRELSLKEGYTQGHQKGYRKGIIVTSQQFNKLLTRACLTGTPFYIQPRVDRQIQVVCSEQI